MTRHREPLPELAPPGGLEAYALEAGGEEFVFLEWPAPAGLVPDSLTAAEREVVRLVLSGLSNRDVARARGTSERTVANQVASLFRKVGASSRLELYARLGGG